MARCMACGRDNLEGRRFCGGCGAPLGIECPSCRSLAVAGDRFCGECGADLSVAPVLEGERRHLTVVFADLVDSTPMAGRLDPEDMRDVLRAFHRVCAEAVERDGGYVARFVGDGMLAYFGYPRAHEDDARRAVSASLRLVAEAESLSGVRARAAVHTGLVVLADMGAGRRIEEADAIGETPNIAARLQSAAAPGTVIVSGATHRLVGRFYRWEPAGSLTLKGVADPVDAYIAGEETGVSSRIDLASEQRLTPLAGRDRELAALRERWDDAVANQATRVVLLSGEPGIGKSRLVRELHESLLSEHHGLAGLRCSELYESSALRPVVAYLEEAIAQRGSNMRETLRIRRLASTRSLAALAALVGTSGPDDASMTPDDLRQAGFELVSDWIEADAREAPLLLVAEDLHWADPSTLELLTLIVDRPPDAPILALFTCRPEFVAPFAVHAHVSVLTLSRLAPEHCRAIVRAAAPSWMTDEVMDRVVARTEGVPLFCEELTSSLVEAGGDVSSIPDTLRDSLVARLDRLGDAKQVAQAASVIGREFAFALLARVVDSQDRLDVALDRLAASGLVSRVGAGRESRYQFKHALVRDAAYDSLLRTRRKELHGRAARALASAGDAEPEVVAHHFAQAELARDAASWWERAADRSVSRSAHSEAVTHLRRAIEALRASPESDERDELELRMQAALGSELNVTLGFGSLEALAAYDRAYDLSQSRLSPELAPILWGIWQVAVVRAPLSSRRWANELLSLGLRLQDIAVQAWGRMALATTQLLLGEFSDGATNARLATELFDPVVHGGLVASFGGEDIGVSAPSIEAMSLWLHGELELALRVANEVLVEISRRDSPYAQAMYAGQATVLFVLAGDTETVIRVADEALEVAEAHGFSGAAVFSTVARAWAVARGGDEAGIDQLTEAIAVWTEAIGGAMLSYIHWLRADLLLGAGRAGESADAADAGIEVATTVGDVWLLADLYRLRGLAALEAGGDGESWLRRAVDEARTRDAPLFELRASLALAEVWSGAGRQRDALDLVTKSYGRFAGGVSAPELRDAEALIARLTAE